MFDTFSQLSTYLTESEKQVLSTCEGVIERGLKSFIEVGTALQAIRDNRLYRENFPTFESYCQDRWNMSKQHAYRLMDATEVINDLKSHQLVTFPESESQTRPLSRVEPEIRAELWQTALDTAPNGKVTAAHVEQVVEEYRNEKQEPKPAPHVSYNSGNNEWYTPKEFTQAARDVMGRIDLDPASSELANELVEAAEIHTEYDNGLLYTWSGKVWMNPPYAGSLIGKFCEKLAGHYRDGEIEEAIVLVNNATETRWFQDLVAFASVICFPSARVSYWSPSGEKGQPLQGQAILYFGNQKNLFIQEFSKFGFLVDVL